MKIWILTGSTLGGAEYVAEHLESLLQQQNIETTLHHGPELADIELDANEEKYWLIVTSTHGAGELPDNLKPFFEQLQQSNQDLNHVKFAVVGLGNSDYDTFCYAVDKVEQILQAKSAVKLCESLKIDVLNIEDQEDFAGQWLPHFIHSFS